ncbi:LamG domain-containing protein [Paracraurococcus lichenis]|uniref:Glycoside hydrolase family 5 domain-containing protein n=1 Tax=Paracraurococcus lichenis TaxID=3064888 RepID=A0ABT9E8T0_9PROT|nr:hypothetical protein [Paracraurococcus sp. LOR1-02]MDO9712388.1 hypothetical protein [Paracraurococcus sp. LOR1-02]
MGLLTRNFLPMVARGGAPMLQAPASVQAKPINSADAKAARDFVAPLTVGVAVERWRPMYMAYGGKPLATDTAYWTYLKGLGITHVRLFLPWRTKIDMYGGWVGGVQPTDAQLGQFFDMVETVIRAGLKVLYECADVLGDDITTNPSDIYTMLDRQANLIVQRGTTRFPKDMIAIGPCASIELGTNAAANAFRLEAHRRLRAKLAGYVLLTGAAANYSPDALTAADWVMVQDQRVILTVHEYAGVPTASQLQAQQAAYDIVSQGNGGVPVLITEAAHGSSTYADTWRQHLYAYAQYQPRTRATLWTVTDGAWFALNVSSTDPTLRPAMEFGVKKGVALIENTPEWLADNPGATAPEIPVEAPTGGNPGGGGGTTTPGTNTIYVSGKLVAGPGSTVFEDFNDGPGLLWQWWHADGPSYSVQNSIARIENYPGADYGDNGAGLYAKPSAIWEGYGYGWFAFRVKAFGGLGYNNDGYWAQGSASVLWPASDDWPGAETDMGEIDSGGSLYYALHYWDGSRDQNGNRRDMFRLIYPPGDYRYNWGEWHTHMCCWGPGYYRWFIDDVEFEYTDTNAIYIDESQTSRAWQFADYAHGGQNKAMGIMLRARNVAIECDFVSWNPL